MDGPFDFEASLSPAQQAEFAALDSPAKIQAFLDKTPYSAESANRCPLSVLRDGVAHCLDGGLFAALALWRLGYPPRLIDIWPEPGTDDDHILAIFQQNGRYGAVAKSNFVGLRFREAVYRSLRELVMSYFPLFFSLNRQKTLRYYTRPLDLRHMGATDWMCQDAGADAVEQRLHQLKLIPLIDENMAASLSLVDPLTYQAGMLGVNEAGLFKPPTL